MMTRRQLAKAAIAHKEAERVPYFVLFTPTLQKTSLAARTAASTSTPSAETPRTTGKSKDGEELLAVELNVNAGNLIFTFRPTYVSADACTYWQLRAPSGGTRVYFH